MCFLKGGTRRDILRIQKVGDACTKSAFRNKKKELCKLQRGTLHKKVVRRGTKYIQLVIGKNKKVVGEII